MVKKVHLKEAIIVERKSQCPWNESRQKFSFRQKIKIFRLASRFTVILLENDLEQYFFNLLKVAEPLKNY